MHKIVFSVFMLTIVSLTSQAQSFWTRIEKSQISSRSGEERTIVPDKYETFHLDLAGLKSYLVDAPREEFRSTTKGLSLMVPNPDGRLENFIVFESPVMQPGLEAKFPSIKSYIAQHATDRSKSMRFAVSPYGFHAAVAAIDGEKYIDPYSSKNIDDYIVYNVADHHPDAYKGVAICGNDEDPREESINSFFNPMRNRTEEVTLRIFRVAMACTGEWGKKRGTVEKCLADINVMMNRMNVIYEKEMAMRFVLINDNEKIIFIDPNTDPYTDSDQGKVILGTNTGIINPRVTGGATAYDIGHVLSICFDIGGVAQGGSACQSNKANGVTCNNDNDLSGIVTRVMSHEVGHQLDAGHTWNICQPNEPETANQRSGDNAYEPGSGTSIMSYAGSCTVDNVATFNDEYFHVRSLQQMYAKTNQGGNAFACSDKMLTGNHYPANTMPTVEYTIPITTPFELKATAEDEDGDVLTYCWEQYDKGEAVALGSNTITGPLFRSFKPSVNGWTRFVPESNNILTGKLVTKNEVLPDKTRDLNWRLTTRDNHAGGAGVVWDSYKVKVTATAGPFKLIFPLTDNKFVVGQKVDVAWDVANTDNAPVNCKFVNIYASYSGALRNEDPNLVPLALNVPNDGGQEVFIPNRISNLLRIVIKAADNIFLTTSTIPSKVEEPTTPTVYFDAPSFIKVCQPSDGLASIKAIGFGGLTDNIQFSILSGIPSGATATFGATSLAPGAVTTLTVNSSGIVGSQTADIIVRAMVPGVDTIDRAITVQYVGGNINNIKTLLPVDGSETDALPKFQWEKKTDASRYRLELSKDAGFGNLIANATLTDSNYVSPSILEPGKVYYWRVTGINECGDGAKGITRAFITKAFNCFSATSGVQNIVLSGAGTPTAELSADVSAAGTVSDVNVKLIKADHSRTGDLVVSLISPSGKSVLLWSKKCGTSQNVNVGVDDQSPSFFQCPINTAKVYRPEGKLSDFNGESTQGIWKLKVEDQVSGSGGKLLEFNLEICASLTPKNPYLVKNETLKVYPTDRVNIGSQLLAAADDDNTADQLSFTIVEIPSRGTLLFNGQVIVAGATFSQTDINNGKLEYESTSNTNATDIFRFVVTDGAGGWINITNFNIDINEANPSPTNDAALLASLNIYPNPTFDQIYIVRGDNSVDFDKYEVRDITGRVVLTGILTSTHQTISVGSIISGVYSLNLLNGDNRISKKLIKI